jgi:hypothetical protein
MFLPAAPATEPCRSARPQEWEGSKMDATHTPVAINTSLPVPVELVELSPNHLSLKSHWSAPLRFLGAPPFSIHAFLLVAGATVVAVAGVIDFMTGQVVVQNLTLAACCLGIALVGAVRTTVLVFLSWATMRWRRGGPVDFDPRGDQLVFGPGTDNLTLSLSTIAALQLIPTTSLSGGAGVWKAATADRSMLGSLLKLFVARTKMYQLNLVLKDGLRLNLANWRAWDEPQRELVRRLAEFLEVPLEGPGDGLTGER